MEIITIILLGISLSIDAFSLSVAYGLLNIKKEKIYLTSLLVGMFHFFMPIFGLLIGNYIKNIIPFDTHYIIIIILLLIGIEMIKSINDDEVKEVDMTLKVSIIFAFLVSLDSLLLGIGLSVITNKILFSSITFSLLSASFTLSGFLLGKYFTNKSKKKAKIIGIIIIFTLIIVFLCK